jgi:signal transduction histidine kinase
MSNVTRSSISKRLTWMNMLVSGAVLLLACVALMAYELITFRETVVRNLSIQAEIIGSNSVSALVFNDPDAAQSTLAALTDAPSIVSAGIYTQDGRLFAGYARQPGSETVSLPPLAADQTQASTSQAQRIGLIRRIVFEGKPLGIVYLRSDLQEIINRLKRFGLILGAVLLVSMVPALVISRMSQRVVSGPIERLAETARRVSVEKDYAVRAASTGKDYELTMLIEAFNEMLGAIQQRDQTVKDARDQLEHRVRERTTALKAANEELEAFSYSVSHDLRAPLRHVIGFAGLLEERAGARLDQQDCRYLKTITDAATRMGQLIDDLLAFSRAARADLAKRRVSLSELVRDARAEIAPETVGRDIVWNVEVLPEVDADPALLRLAIANLLSNAVKYTSTRPSAHIDVGTREPLNGEVVVFVRDDGVGFDMKYGNKLFGVFQRLHGEEFSGTGIGLANVRRIIHRHGGRTWAEGELNRGATFYFSLPDLKRSHDHGT